MMVLVSATAHGCDVLGYLECSCPDTSVAKNLNSIRILLGVFARLVWWRRVRYDCIHEYIYFIAYTTLPCQQLPVRVALPAWAVRNKPSHHMCFSRAHAPLRHLAAALVVEYATCRSHNPTWQSRVEASQNVGCMDLGFDNTEGFAADDPVLGDAHCSKRHVPRRQVYRCLSPGSRY